MQILENVELPDSIFEQLLFDRRFRERKEIIGDRVLDLHVVKHVDNNNKIENESQINNNKISYTNNHVLTKFYEYLYPNATYLKSDNEKADFIEALIGVMDEQSSKNFINAMIEYINSVEDKSLFKYNNPVNAFLEYALKIGEVVDFFYYDISDDKICIITFQGKKFRNKEPAKSIKIAKKNACKTACSYFKIPYSP